MPDLNKSSEIKSENKNSTLRDLSSMYYSNNKLYLYSYVDQLFVNKRDAIQAATSEAMPINLLYSSPSSFTQHGLPLQAASLQLYFKHISMYLQSTI